MPTSARADVGGKKEALATKGSTWGTKDPDIALVLFEGRLADLRAKRKGQAGATTLKTTTLVELVRHHLLMKAQVGKTSDQHLKDLETRLRLALEFFGRDRDPRTIEPDDVRQWGTELAEGGTRKPGTVRHYLNALSSLYGRAREGLFVAPGYNPVADLQEKPTGHGKAEAKFFEVAGRGAASGGRRYRSGPRPWCERRAWPASDRRDISTYGRPVL